MEKEIFAKRLRSLREEKNLKQVDVSEFTYIQSKTLSDYERAVSLPDINNLVTLAKFFKVSADYLLGVSDVREEKREEIKPDDFQFALYGATQDLSDNQKAAILELVKLFRKQ